MGREDIKPLGELGGTWVSDGVVALYNCINAVRKTQAQALSTQPNLPSSISRDLMLLAGLFQ